MLRQTVLPFKALATNPTVSRPGDSNLDIKRASSTVDLPVELWYMIIESLQRCTYILKSLRLVCRYWAKVGSEFLFSIVYLDNYKPSWQRLRQLCLSSYAPFVKQIEWNPLVMYEDCLDPGVWRRNYPHLLQGIRHETVIQLHEAYCRTYQKSRKQGRLETPDVQALVTVLSELRNCRALSLNDDSDFESSCADGITHKRLQNDATMWRKTSMWGRMPRVVGQHPNPQTCTFWELLRLPNSIPTITHLKINLWEATWDCPREIEPLPAFTSVHLTLKSYRLASHDSDALLYFHENARSYGPVLGHSSVSRFISSFPNLQKLCLGTSYHDPGIAFVRDFEAERLRLEEEDNEVETETERLLFDEEENELADDADNLELVSTATHFAELEEREGAHWPAGITPAMVSAHLARLNLRFVPTSQLRDLTLSDVSVDLRSLTFWLIGLHELHRQPLTLRFSGHVFLHSLKQDVFLAVMNKLNVRIFCHPDTAFCHGDLAFDQRQDFLLSFSEREDEDPYYSRPPSVCHDLYPWPNLKPCEYLPDSHVPVSWNSCDTLDNSRDTHVSIDFEHPPQLWRAILSKHITTLKGSGDRLSYVYCYHELPKQNEKCSETRRFVFQWIDESRYVSSLADAPTLHALIRLDIHGPLSQSYVYRQHAFYATPIEAQTSLWSEKDWGLWY